MTTEALKALIGVRDHRTLHGILFRSINANLTTVRRWAQSYAESELLRRILPKLDKSVGIRPPSTDTPPLRPQRAAA
jgi:hypothetical protein